MTYRRSTRNLLCRFLAGVLLYAQLAVAAYACPGPAAMAMAHDTGTASAAMPGCDATIATTDAGASNLCAEHCHQGQQSDQVQTVAVAPVVLASLYPMPVAPHAVVPVGAGASGAPGLAAAPLPHAILHCCFRI